MVMPDNTTIHPSAVDSTFADIREIIADMKNGKMVIMVDDENRENEGDLIMAAEKVRPETLITWQLMVVDWFASRSRENAASSCACR
jgi:hypothetical protein